MINCFQWFFPARWHLICTLGLLLLLPREQALALTAAALFPADNATGVCRDVNPRIIFDAAPTKGASGSLRIYRASDNALIKQINAVNPTTGTLNPDVANKPIGDGRPVNYYPIIIQGNTVLIDPTNSILAYNTAYYIQIDATVFPGYAGIADTVSWTFTTKPAAPVIGTDISVNFNGSGDFCTVQGAIDAIASNNTAPRTIHIAAGQYEEELVCHNKHNLTFRGDNRDNTIIRYATNNNFQGYNGFTSSTDNRPMFALQSNDTTLRDLTFHNTTPVNGSQAESIRIKGAQRVVVRDCNFESYQDTILADGRVYFWNCYIEGDVDYVWGSGGVYFERCQFHTLRNGYLCQARNNSAQATPSAGPYGYIFVNCTLTAAPGVTSLYFNRIDPSRFPFSNVAMIDCVMGSFVNPAGWLLNNVFTAPTVGFWEYHSVDPQGRPVSTTGRLPTYSLQLSPAEAEHLHDVKNVLGGPDNWNPKISQVFETSPLGYASIDALGQNGTNGGAGGTVVTVSNQADLEFYCNQTAPYIIQVQGTIPVTPFGSRIDVQSNKTILGIGSGAVLTGGGFSVQDKKNIIFQNLTIRDSYIMGDYDGKDPSNDNDGIALRNTHHVWIDHCHFDRCGDGLIDATTGSSYITVSWCVLSDNNKTCGFGVGTLADPERITTHHCWFLNTNQRNTRNEQARIHHFNNYWGGITFYCNNSKTNTEVLIENCYFKESRTPHDEEEGLIRAAGNVYFNATGAAESSGDLTTIPAPTYAYSLDPAGIVPQIVVAGAGPDGGSVYTDNHFETIKVNFVPAGEAAAYSYLSDNGAAFGNRGNGFSYGWNTGNTANAIWRENNNLDIPATLTPTDVDRRRNGLITFGNGTRSWELALANGFYDLHILCGDPHGRPNPPTLPGWTTVSAINTIDAEGVPLTDPDGADDYDAYQTTVSVSDGRLTIGQGAGGADARICFIEITAATSPGDTTPPAPNPLTWLVEPQATGQTSIAMTATTASDLSGVEYYFYNLTNPAHDSGWQSSSNYTDTGLIPATAYTYEAAARDLSTAQNQTGTTPQRSATTDTPPDTTPPAPNPLTWSIDPHATGQTTIEMTASTASDASGVEYYFSNLTSPAHDSGWQSSASYTDSNLSPNTTYTYQAMARDMSVIHNQTGSTPQSAATTPGAQTDASSVWILY